MNAWKKGYRQQRWVGRYHHKGVVGTLGLRGKGWTTSRESSEIVGGLCGGVMIALEEEGMVEVEVDDRPAKR